jgi:hypothetical protein
MTRWSLPTIAALAVTAALGPAPAARAGMLPVSFSVIPEGDHFRFTYGVVLTTDAFIQAGDFFTIYDFGGLIPGSTSQPDGWSVLTGVGKTPGDTSPIDDPGIPNITWIYQGPAINGQQGLGNFMANSTFQNFDFGSFTARTNRMVDGRVDHNITDTQVPVPGPGHGPNPQTPEPATLALAGLGLPALLLLLRRRAA